MEDTIHTNCVCVCVHGHAVHKHTCTSLCVCANLFVSVDVGVCVHLCALFFFSPDALSLDLRWSRRKMETRERRTTPFTSPFHTPCAKSQLQIRRLDDISSSIGLTTALLFCV